MSDEKLITALMLLEMGMDGLNPEYGADKDYMEYAHAYVQAAGTNGTVAIPIQKIVAKIRADLFIEGLKHG